MAGHGSAMASSAVEDTRIALSYGTIDDDVTSSRRWKMHRLSKVLFAASASILVFLLLTYSPQQDASGNGPFHTVDAEKATFGSSSRAQKLTGVTEADLAALPADVVAALNTSMDPCDDFYEFSCGSWDAAARIPSYQPSWAKQWDVVTENVENITIAALEKDEGVAGKFYRACMDMAAIQKVGATPVAPWLEKVEKIVDHSTLMETIIEFAIADIDIFWSWWVDPDNTDSNLYSFFIAQGGITMPDRSYYLEDSDKMKKHREAYTTMMVNIMKLAGRSQAEAEEDARNTMELETALARAMTPRAQQRDVHAGRMSMPQLQELAPDINWARVIGGLGIKDLGTKEGGFLNVKNTDFLTKMSSVLKQIGIPKIQSYMRWTAVYSYAPMLDLDFEHELLRYNKEVYGITVLPPRRRKCFFSVNGAMDMPTSKLFIEAAFPEESRQAALTMLSEIRDQFNASLQHKEWMDEGTRTKAVEKLKKMFLEVGHPTVWPPATFETYDAYGGIGGGYFDNCVATNAREVKTTLERLGTKVDKRRWGSSSATDVNSYYARKVNGIFIPAGILQPPFYSREQAVARNYGSVGAICGHEMTHGFDDVGREYDGDGNRNGWWPPAVVSAFQERAECISDLFSSYSLFGAQVNGPLVLGEAIADSGGLKYAWESFVKAEAPDPIQKKLFFIAMGQTWCEKQTAKGATAEVLTDQHPPNKFRVIGTLSQFPPFAETFQCPADTQMNPPKRCHLW